MKRASRLWAVCAPSFLFVSFVSTAAAQETAEYYRQNCFSCHTIGGGRLAGPDLKDVSSRQERDWLIRFILDPLGMLESGDPYALQLLEEAQGIIMPDVAGMTAGRAAAILDLIDQESKLERSEFKGLQVSDRPFTPEDVELGRSLFSGEGALSNGGPACLGCHTVGGLPALSGGKLGPDLTRAYERLGGRKSIVAWMASPPTANMTRLYRTRPLEPEEILPLTAYLERTAKEGAEDRSAAVLNFFFLGLGGAVVFLVVFDAVWKRRFRGVRAALVGNGNRLEVS